MMGTDAWLSRCAGGGEGNSRGRRDNLCEGTGPEELGSREGCVCACVQVCVLTSANLCTRTHVCGCVIHVHMCVCVRCVCVCTCICTICMPACVSVCACVYTRVSAMCHRSVAWRRAWRAWKNTEQSQTNWTQPPVLPLVALAQEICLPESQEPRLPKLQ